MNSYLLVFAAMLVMAGGSALYIASALIVGGALFVAHCLRSTGVGRLIGFRAVQTGRVHDAQYASTSQRVQT